MGFCIFNISNATSVGQVLQKVDRANGCVIVSANTVQEDIFQVAIQESGKKFETIREIRELLQPAKK